MEKENTTYERRDVEKTPFSIIIEQPNGKCRIAVGMQFVTEEEYENHEKALETINEKPWELILNTVIILHENIHKLNNETEKEVQNA